MLCSVCRNRIGLTDGGQQIPLDITFEPLGLRSNWITDIDALERSQRIGQMTSRIQLASTFEGHVSRTDDRQRFDRTGRGSLAISPGRRVSEPRDQWRRKQGNRADERHRTHHTHPCAPFARASRFRADTDIPDDGRVAVLLSRRATESIELLQQEEGVI